MADAIDKTSCGSHRQTTDTATIPFVIIAKQFCTCNMVVSDERTTTPIVEDQLAEQLAEEGYDANKVSCALFFESVEMMTVPLD